MKTLFNWTGRQAMAGLAIVAAGMCASHGHADCAADLNDDGTVDGVDLGLLLALWGDAGGPADLNVDGVVDGSDLGLILAAWESNCATAMRVELAGRALAGYPHFDFVQAFNQGTTVQAAIDFSRFPQVIDQTADIFVTAAKSDEAWQTDPSLSDVRASGFQTIAFAGATIQDGTWTLDLGTLDGEGGLDLAIGYDVVVDMNRNGVLDGGDLYDGAAGADGAEAGFYVVRDLTAAGPYEVTTKIWQVTGVTGAFTSETVYYPTNIAELGLLPLVVISHGNGHQYIWYDYLGNHLASYGYIVMSHQNNTMPGIEAASTTTLQHTQAIIGQHATLGDGVLNGHLDADTIVWIGHSRGGEGVVRAYDRIFDGTFTPTNYTLDDIKLISSIAPTDFLGTGSSNPHSATYHLIYGGSDGDVCGCPDNDIADSFNLYERAAGVRQSMYIHGASHNDFVTGNVPQEVQQGPNQLSKTETQLPAKAMWLVLVEYYIDGNVAVKDFLWRQFEVLRPIGVGANVVAVLDYHDGPAAGALEVDDFQTNTATNVSSTGGAVASSVTNLTEAKMNDGNTSFTWLASDPMNGMVRGRTSDVQRCAAFDWDGEAFLEFALPEATDLSSFAFLQFRANQGPRHPNTTAALENLTFNVLVRDSTGVESSVSIGAYGAGIQEPYQRTGFGTGAGWQSELEVIRIRLTDFLTNGSGVDLTSIAAIRLDFGQAGSSAKGRLGFDDLRITLD
jgi:hypothetical protein